MIFVCKYELWYLVYIQKTTEALDLLGLHVITHGRLDRQKKLWYSTKTKTTLIYYGLIFPMQ